MPATFDYFQYPRAEAGREQLLSGHKSEVLTVPGQGGTVLGEIVGWGERVTKTSSSLGTPVPCGSLHKKMEEYRLSKKILEQEPT